MKFTGKEVLKSSLGEFFKYNLYTEAIKNLRTSIREKEYYHSNWQNVIRLVINKELKEGEALYIMDNDANLTLHHNTDEEAYKWLQLMLINSLGSEDAMIIEY